MKDSKILKTGEELHWQNQNIIQTLAFLWQDRFGDWNSYPNKAQKGPQKMVFTVGKPIH